MIYDTLYKTMYIVPPTIVAVPRPHHCLRRAGRTRSPKRGRSHEQDCYVGRDGEIALNGFHVHQHVLFGRFYLPSYMEYVLSSNELTAQLPNMNALIICSSFMTCRVEEHYRF